MSVDLLVGRLVLALVLSLDVRHRLRESVGACRRARGKEKQWVKATPWPGTPANTPLGDVGSLCGAAAAQVPSLLLRDGHRYQPGLLPGRRCSLTVSSAVFLFWVAVYRDEIDEGGEC